MNNIEQMPFREKSAWISLVCLPATFGAFFLAMATGLVPTSGILAVKVFFGCTAGFVLLQLGLYAAAAMRAPADARAARDERERLIALKAARNAWAVLVCGMLITAGSLHLGLQQSQMGYLAMAFLVLSEMVRAASCIFYFRRGH